MNPQHPPHGPQVAAGGSATPDPIGDQGAVPGGAQGSSEGREAIKLRDQIDDAMHGYMCPDCQLPQAFDAVMRPVEAALAAMDAEIEQLKRELREYQQANTKLQEINLRRNEEARRANERAEQAEVARDRLRAQITALRRMAQVWIDIRPEHPTLTNEADGVAYAGQQIIAALDQPKETP